MCRLSRRLSKDTLDEIVRQYRIWGSTRKVAEVVYVSHSSVVSTLKKRRVQMKPRGGPNNPVPRDQLLRTANLYTDGYSVVEIGRMLGHSHSTIVNRLKVAGVPIRDRSVSARLVAQRRRALTGRAWGPTQVGVETAETGLSGASTTIPVGVPEK